MKKLFLNLILLISFIFSFQPASLGETPDFKIAVKGHLTKTENNLEETFNLTVYKTKNETFNDLLKKYTAIKTDFNYKYRDQRKLIIESSTIKQAFEHSKDLLDLCSKYKNKYKELKEDAYLQLLIGEWSGTSDLELKEEQDDYILIIKRSLKVSFESNHAGQISKGIVNGTETVIKKRKTEIEEIEDERIIIPIENTILETDIKSIKGSITGNIIPQADSTFIININKTKNNNNVKDEINNIKIKAKTDVELTPLVPANIIDESYSLTVSHMKIYYDLIFKTRMPTKKILEEKYNYFFQDILHLLSLNAKGYISKEVYIPLHIYSKSKYLNHTFEDYVMTLCSYYNKLILQAPNTSEKLAIYRAYLSELIQASSICQLNLVGDDTINTLGLNINTTNNLIERVFVRYYKAGKSYYKKILKDNTDSDKSQIQKQYSKFKKDIKKFTTTGIIHKNVLKELDLD